MYAFELSGQKHPPEPAMLEQYLWALAFCLRAGGNVRGTPSSLATSEGRFCWRGLCEEEIGLAETCYHRKTREIYAKFLAEIGRPSLSICGEVSETDPACICDVHEFLVLFTVWDRDYSPVLCGSCGRPVPLYRFNDHLSFSDLIDIQDWESEYKSMDRLHLYFHEVERLALRMLQSVESPLGRRGMNLRTRLEEATGIRIFYGLGGILSPYRIRKGCEACGKPWGSPPDSLGHFDVGCEECRLVASSGGSESARSCIRYLTSHPLSVGMGLYGKWLG